MKIIGEYLYFNGRFITPAQLPAPDPDDGVSIYEVIRLMNGVPLFLEMHFFRMINSAAVIRLGITPKIGDLACNIRDLARINGISNGNVRVNVFFPPADMLNYDMLITFIPHRYPHEEEYRDGVAASGLHAERPNPQAKINNRPLRSKADDLIESRKVYEILLINNHGHITEGSRSNIFFVEDRRICTPPESDILPGITRNMVMEICREKGFELKEEKIDYSRRHQFQSVFITGTSPKVLPVSEIDGVHFQPAYPLTREIMAAYDEKIENYLKNFDYDCLI
ncbi:MAG: aminotransferase class IV [Bacteroidales bacterium]